MSEVVEKLASLVYTKKARIFRREQNAGEEESVSCRVPWRALPGTFTAADTKKQRTAVHSSVMKDMKEQIYAIAAFGHRN